MRSKFEIPILNQISKSEILSNLKFRFPVQVLGSHRLHHCALMASAADSYYKNKDDMLKGIVTPVEHIISENE